MTKTVLTALMISLSISVSAKEPQPTFSSAETLMTLVNKGKTCTSNDRGTECNYRVPHKVLILRPYEGWEREFPVSKNLLHRRSAIQRSIR